ncbi:MAG TPA: LUD domain-containing protein [Candidatus Saccharimonadales bacterium]|nr:LUD domain-containing protein [Candidatus Saccharimonadales bacterium]
MQWDTLVNSDSLTKTIDALKQNGIEAVVVDSAKEAKETVIKMLPEKAEVMTMTSITLETSGITDVVNTSDKFVSLRDKLAQLDREKDNLEMQRVGAAPEWTLGSVHAVTEDGKVIIASNTGSQLPAYAYGSSHVIWVIGTQKIVKNLDDAMTRIYDYVLPLETKRARKAYNLPDSFNSNVSKLLIVNKEVNPTRLKIVFVKEKLGF